MRLLLTGATGKVGKAFLAQFLAQSEYADWAVTAVCHNRQIESSDRVNVIKGSIADPKIVSEAMKGITHVLHMAAVKESPDMVIDVALKAMFLLLEEARQSETLKQFILIGGDCSVGHIFYRYPAPITEEAPRMAYPGCYALTKVVEEVMVEQYQIQYGLNGCILRAPWIMEKDDFKYALSFGEDQFGGPAWTEFMPAKTAAAHARDGKVPLMRDADGAPLKRNFVHVDDLVKAIIAALDNPAAKQSLYNICMNEPIDYQQVANYLETKKGIESVDVSTPYFSNWLDNSKARLQLGWQPDNDFEALIERAWAYERSPSDPRKIWYPG